MLLTPGKKKGVKNRMNTFTFNLEEKETKEYLKSVFDILILKGKQSLPLYGHEADEISENLFTPENFQALLVCQINFGEEVLRKHFEITEVNTFFC